MTSSIYLDMAIALLLALLSSKIIKMVHLPNVTGYLIMGLLAGPSFLNIISLETIGNFSIVPEVALGFIAFSIGAEFKLDYFKKIGRSPIIIAILEALGATLFVVVALIAAGFDVSFSLLLGAIASATSPAATLMVIRQYKAKGPVTDTLLPVVAIDDAIAIMVFGIALAITKSLRMTESVSLISTLVGPVIEIVGSIGFGVLMGIVLKLFIDWFKESGNRLAISIAMVMFCIGVSKITLLSSLLTCMAMSATYVNISKVSHKVFDQVEKITPPLFMLFFFLSGAGLDMSLLSSVGLAGMIYIVSRVAGKVFGAGMGAHISNAQPVVKKYLGFNLIPQAGVAIGLANIVYPILPEYGVQIRTVILCATIIYELIGPVTTKLALTKAGEIQEIPVKKPLRESKVA